jgi:hypothetical protein
MASDAARLCDAVAQLNGKYGSRKSLSSLPASAQQIVEALGQFMDCVRYLNTRRSEAAILKLDSEAAVQDALFLMLRPWITDLTWENPTDKIAGRFAIKDFLSKSARVVIEAKYVRDAAHGKNLTKELHDDIENYRNHSHCRDLVFIVYDPDVFIPDRQALERQIVVNREYDGVPLSCHLVVKP